MRNLVMVMVAGLSLCLVMTRTLAAQIQAYDLKAEEKQLKSRHKEERKALKLKEKYTKQSWKGHGVSKGAQLQVKHQMEREKRELRDKQRDERQDLKDRRRLLKDTQQAYR